MSDKPKSFTIKPDGLMTTRVHPDGSVSSSSEQPMNIHIESIKSIGIENLVDVEIHAINRVFNSASHYIKFFGGGEVRFSYNAEGELLEFSGTGVLTQIVNGERIVLRKKPTDANTGA